MPVGSRAGEPNVFIGCYPAFTLRKGAGRISKHGWYGGKFSHLGWLLPLLPECHHYCEPFAGSAAVLPNRDPSPVETYNDVDGAVVNFFRVLRSRPEELTRLIGLTPFSREELAIAVTDQGDASDVERARRFYVRARQARTGLAQTPRLGVGELPRHQPGRNVRGGLPVLGSVDQLPEIALRRPKTLFYCDPLYVHSCGDK